MRVVEAPQIRKVVEFAVRQGLPRLRALGGRRAQQLSVGSLALLLIAIPSWLGHSLSTPLPRLEAFPWLDLSRSWSWPLPFIPPGFWLLSRSLAPRRPPWKWGPPFLSLPLAALLALSIAQAPLALDTRSTGQLMVYQVALSGLYLMAVNAPIPRAAVAGSLAAGLALQAAIALPQSVLGHSLGLETLGETEVAAWYQGASVVVMDQRRWLRAYGLTTHPNLLGGYLMIAMLVVGGYYLGRGGRPRIPLLLAMGLGLAALLVTFSRSAWIGAALGVLVMVALNREANGVNWRALAGPMAVAMVVGMGFLAADWQLVVPRLGGSGEETEVRSVEERQLLNEAALALIQRRPMPGVGLGNFSAAVPDLVPESPLGPPVQPVHNVPLLAATELGLPGGLLWLFLMAAPWVALGAARKRIQVTPWLAGLSGAMAAVTVVSMLDYYLWIPYPGSALQWLLWGLWAREWLVAMDPSKSRGGVDMPEGMSTGSG